MHRFCLTALFSAGICLFSFSNMVMAGTPSKGLKIDPLLEKAILDSAKQDVIEEVEVEEVPTEEPVFEEELPEEIIIPEPEVIEFVEPLPEEPKEPREIGVMFNGIKFLPSMIAKLGWNDNVFAVDEFKQADYLTYLTPRLRIEIPDIHHDISFDGSYEIRKHAELTSEDMANIKTRFGGALNAERGLSVPFEFSWQSIHEEREDDLTQQRPDSPFSIDDFKAEGGLQFKPGAFGISLLGHFHKQRYEDGTSTFNGTRAVRRDADRDITQLEFNTSFDLDPANTFMLWGTVGDRDYERNNFQGGGFNGPLRSSDTFSGMLSWIFDHGDISGHMSFGVQDYNYDDITIQDVRELVGDIEIDHQIGDMTSINFQAARSLYEDEEVIDPIILSRAGIYLDHQAWEDVLIAGGFDYEFLEFNNTGRDDDQWKFRLIADYFMNEVWAFGAEFIRTERNSELDNLDFGRNMVLLRARGRL